MNSVKQTQCTDFQEEWKALAHRRPLPTNNKLLALKPKLDNDGLMRSDGRLQMLNFFPMTYDTQ